MICRSVKTTVYKNSINLSESIMQFYTPVELREIMLIPLY
ncbi:DNA polymerase V subunit UmuD, partial [Klebsiella pneumoniae]|nr:DNA polymerase V subunit UmuD [Klebsiella pneumoniae]